MLSLSGSGRASLMSFWARQVRGVLPVRIKPVLAQSSGVPASSGRIGARGVPVKVGAARGSRRADRPDGVVIRVVGCGEQRDSREGQGDRDGVRAVVQLADEHAGGWRDDAGSPGAHRQHDLVVLESRTCHVRRLVHARDDRATSTRNRATSLRRIREPVITREGILGRSCAARDPSHALQARRRRSCSRGDSNPRTGATCAMQVFMFPMLLGCTRRWPSGQGEGVAADP